VRRSFKALSRGDDMFVVLQETRFKRFNLPSSGIRVECPSGNSLRKAPIGKKKMR
jgi:hypothetical protein